MMNFSLDNPGFFASTELYPSVLQNSAALLPPSAFGSSSSAPSSRDSARRSCPKCHRRMSKALFDCHTVCFKCRGFDCSHDKNCDECLDGSLEEMEAYVNTKSLSSVKRNVKRGNSLRLPLLRVQSRDTFSVCSIFFFV